MKNLKRNEKIQNNKRNKREEMRNKEGNVHKKSFEAKTKNCYKALA